MDSNIKEIKSARVGESCFKIEHRSGLTIYVYPKRGYNSAYAVFGTKYGSINTSFSVDDGERITVPDGIAHYLEHKLFESEEGDAFTRYAKTGANANAFTSFEKTCYLFSCTDKLDESLEILLDFVTDPYFTAETVAKEQGIIGQEIKMYDDSPEWRVMFNMLEGMYKNHPVKIDIAGTVETIAEITAEKLYSAYNVFYNLDNMVLCVAGNVDVQQVIRAADKILKPCEKHEIHNYFPDEPYEVCKSYVHQSFPVTVPLFSLGFKEKADSLLDARGLALTDILLNMLASPSSAMYRELLDKKLINSSFSYELFEGPGYRSVIFGGESKDPKQAAQVIEKHISRMKSEGLDKEDFEISKKSVYGEAVAGLDSVSSAANSMVTCHFNGIEMFSYQDETANADIASAARRLEDMLDVDNCTLSVVSQGENGVPQNDI